MLLIFIKKNSCTFIVFLIIKIHFFLANEYIFQGFIKKIEKEKKLKKTVLTHNKFL